MSDFLAFLRTARALALLSLSTLGLVYAMDPPLRVHWRRHHETVREEGGDPRAPGFLILTPTNPKAKLGIFESQLNASLVLPKRGDKNVDAIIPRVRLMNSNSVIAVNHFRVDLSEQNEKDIQKYLSTTRKGELEAGKRFEPVLELRGFTVDGEPATAAVIVPTYLELEIDSKATDTDEDTVVFRGVFVPPSVRELVGVAGYWKTDPNIDGAPADPSNRQCTVGFNKKTDVLTFHFLNRLLLSRQLQKLGQAEKGLAFIFEPVVDPELLPEAASAVQLVLPRFRRDPKGIDRGNQLTLRRPARLQFPRRNFRFNANAPASNDEMPLFLAGSFSSSSNASGKQTNIANFDIKLNMSDKLVPQSGFLNFGNRYSITPAFFAKMNTTGIVNDENSAIWQLPFTVDFFPGACCTGKEKTDFRIPFLRRVSLYAGYLGEAARISNKRSHGTMVESRLFFTRVKSENFSYKFQTIWGWEYGRYREITTNDFTQSGPAGIVNGTNGKPNTESFTVARAGTFSRLRGGVHSSLAIGPSSTFNINFDMRRLLRAETYFDEAASSEGYFTPYPREGFPSTFQSVDSKLAFISAGKPSKGTRRYLDITFNQEITKFFDIKISYSRGELAPAFQFVNKFEAGIALKILGKDSASSR